MTTHPLWRPYAPSANAARQSERVDRRQVPPGPIQQHQRRWADDYVDLRRRIESVLHDQVRAITHVGSTAVPGLVAKPVIDIDLTVAAVTDEAAYLPALEGIGFRLIFRDDLGGDPHRQLTFADPNANLHVWSPGAIEPQRHLIFLRWLNDHSDDRDRYAAAKRAAVDSSATQRYNDAKSAVVYDLYERAFLADLAHQHDPQPRTVAPGRAAGLG